MPFLTNERVDANPHPTAQRFSQPLDHGAADHFVGMKLPQLTLQATTGAGIDVGAIPGLLVMYCYPMTGQPNVPLPEDWEQSPGVDFPNPKPNPERHQDQIAYLVKQHTLA